jgi:hypothetical protein
LCLTLLCVEGSNVLETVIGPTILAIVLLYYLKRLSLLTPFKASQVRILYFQRYATTLKNGKLEVFMLSPLPNVLKFLQIFFLRSQFKLACPFISPSNATIFVCYLTFYKFSLKRNGLPVFFKKVTIKVHNEPNGFLHQ